MIKPAGENTGERRSWEAKKEYVHVDEDNAERPHTRDMGFVYRGRLFLHFVKGDKPKG